MDREEKLQTLAKRQNPQKIALITGDDFSDVLDDKIKALTELLGAGIELTNTEDLLDQLGVLQSFHQEVRSLKEAIHNIDVPATISIKGMEGLIAAVDAINRVEPVEKAITGLLESFGSVIKSINGDIYSRYAYANSGFARGGQYIGYLAEDGNWFIQRIGSAQNNDSSSAYTAGGSNYALSWKRKESLDYLPRDQVTIA